MFDLFTEIGSEFRPSWLDLAYLLLLDLLLADMTAPSQMQLDPELTIQLDLLKECMTAFDSGNLRKAKQLAAMIRMLVSDGRHSVSLLRTLGVIDSVEYFHARRPGRNIEAVLFYVGLGSSASNGIDLDVSTFGTSDYRSGFEKWWYGIVLVARPQRILHTRKDLVLSISSFDERELAGLDRRPDGRSVQIALLRQIAQELYESIKFFFDI